MIKINNLSLLNCTLVVDENSNVNDIHLYNTINYFNKEYYIVYYAYIIDNMYDVYLATYNMIIDYIKILKSLLHFLKKIIKVKTFSQEIKEILFKYYKFLTNNSFQSSYTLEYEFSKYVRNISINNTNNLETLFLVIKYITNEISNLKTTILNGKGRNK